ncbi:unnamed protein product [Brassicogethes aeneus]|uniref:Lipase domain-containing protein n=1 Tax=Brassicogethes aeneus TaxID=1431903 RepID=A0A9P0B4U6_BRAAE|nr:unnamed protein product [Brassicogethes aeneus]
MSNLLVINFEIILIILKVIINILGQDTVTSNYEFFNECYGELGCISTDIKWYNETYRPVNLKPLERQKIKTEFLVINRNANNQSELTYSTVTNEPQFLKTVCFGSHKKLLLLIHDFTSNGYTGWIKHIAQKLICDNSYIIISVDWQNGADPPLDQAVANARLVALEINYFLKNVQVYSFV